MRPARQPSWTLLLLLLLLHSAVRHAASLHQRLSSLTGCHKGLLDGRRGRAPQLALDELLILSLTPMADTKRGSCVELVFRTRHGRATHVLDLSQTPGVGCWVSLRHVHTSEVITKVLWPEGVLQGFEETLISVALRRGVLKVAALTLHGSPLPSHTQRNTPLETSPAPAASYFSGPYLLLTSLRTLPRTWQAPASVQLRLPPALQRLPPALLPAPLYYTVSCHPGRLRWAWEKAIGVQPPAQTPLLAWGLVGALACALALALVGRWALPCMRTSRAKDAATATPAQEAPTAAAREHSLSASAFTNYAYLFN